MYSRAVHHHVARRLDALPAVALLGPRQVGKTTLARAIASDRPSVYLDLERPSDRSRLADPEYYLAGQRGRLVILDEVHRVPALLEVLRGVIDDRRAAGERAGQFLLLGSASLDLLRQTSETLAGRLAFVELGPLGVDEATDLTVPSLWLRGGFPDSVTAADDAASVAWRQDFVRTYLERDIPALGPRVPAETMRRLWTMLAHEQGGRLNAAGLARSLAVHGSTVGRYLDLLVDLLLVRRLPPLQVYVGKRLVKSPKVFVRDSGIVHALLGITTHDELLSHPIAGASWEGFVVEQLIARAPPLTVPTFYRTSGGAEVDLVLDLPGGRRWLVEVKLGLAPRRSRGFHEAVADLDPERCFVVHGGDDRWAMDERTEAIGLAAMVEVVRGAG